MAMVPRGTRSREKNMGDSVMSEVASKIPEEIAVAILKVQREIPTRMANDAKNDYGGWNYLSIDGYYEAIRPLLCDAGLICYTDEGDLEISADGRSLKNTYRFTLAHESGAVWGPITRNLVHTNQGAQSIGAMQSYAEKFFYRSLFKIATGEPDNAPVGGETADIDAGKKAPASKMAPTTQADRKFFFVLAKNGEPELTFDDLTAWGQALRKACDNAEDPVDVLTKNEVNIKTAKTYAIDKGMDKSVSSINELVASYGKEIEG